MWHCFSIPYIVLNYEMYNQLNLCAPNLVAMIKIREKAAAGSLFDQYAKILSLVIFHIVGNRAKTADLLERTIVTIWLTIDQYNDQETTFLAWSIAIAKNLAIELQETEVVKLTPVELVPGNIDLNLSI